MEHLQAWEREQTFPVQVDACGPLLLPLVAVSALSQVQQSMPVYSPTALLTQLRPTCIGV